VEVQERMVTEGLHVTKVRTGYGKLQKLHDR